MIPLVDLVAQYHDLKEEIDAALQEVLSSGQFILGPQVEALENEIAAYTGVEHAVGLASGTDALILALRALEIGSGDEVLLPAYTFFATAGAILSVGAVPVFVDIDPRTYNLDVNRLANHITSRSRAVIPVHLYGQPADMAPLLETCRAQGLKVIEDNAQAFGAEYRGRKTGALADLACLSFFPTKNLGAYGDGGMLLTDDPRLAETVRKLRTHGWREKYFPEVLGYNSRLDTLQAAILRVKLEHLDAWNARRRRLASRYTQAFADLEITCPTEMPDSTHVYHLYVVRLEERDRVRQALKRAGIATGVYYPQPAYLAGPCRRFGYRPGDYPVADQASRETLALPLYPEMDLAQQDEVIRAVRECCR